MTEKKDINIVKSKLYDLVCEIEKHQAETKNMAETRQMEFSQLVKKRQDLHKTMNKLIEK